MILTLKVDSEAIKEINIPIENPDYKLDKEQLARDFQEWVFDYFI